ncbi:MAG: DUF5591 domain-containing protein [Sulfolobus sp.]
MCPPISYHGRVVKTEDNDPFQHPAVKEWHNYLFTKWRSDKRVAFLLPCTQEKPYYKSPTHVIAYSVLKDANVQIYSVSEPMLLVPRVYEDCYPFSDYDYPPSKMTPKEKEEFIQLLSEALKVISKHHEVIIGVLPKHHFNVVSEASKRTGIKIELHHYGRLAFKTVKEVALRAKDLSSKASL